MFWQQIISSLVSIISNLQSYLCYLLLTINYTYNRDVYALVFIFRQDYFSTLLFPGKI